MKSNYTQKERHEDHMKNRFAAWLCWLNYRVGYTIKNNNCFISGFHPTVKDMTKIVDAMWKKIFESGSGELQNIYFFKDAEVEKFYEKEITTLYEHGNGKIVRGRKKVEPNECASCRMTGKDLDKFAEINSSACWQRGGSKWELDRKHCYMSTYLKDEEKRQMFVVKAKDFIDVFFKDHNVKGETIKERENLEKIKEIWSTLRNDEKELKDKIFSLPAPYNLENCEWVCYYCNNAKSDFFTKTEFSPVASGIAEAIKNCIEIQQQNVKSSAVN